MTRNTWIIALCLCACLILGGVVFWWTQKKEVVPPLPAPVATTTPEVVKPTGLPVEKVIGTSVEGRAIKAYTYGTGSTSLLFVGGIHGGYEWNSVYLAYRMMDYLQANPTVIPANVAATIIPSANPDGVFKVVGVEGRFALEHIPAVANTAGTGRFNAHEVDLNRNFGCKWQSTSMWKGHEVKAGTEAFSEPEAAAIRDYVQAVKPAAAIFWHSAANAVYASECNEGVLPKTTTLMNTYASAAQYKAVASFDAYPVTGDAEGWLASIGIPAITIELSTHDSADWDKNLIGTKAVLNLYRNK
jgi:predicted deacylase